MPPRMMHSHGPQNEAMAVAVAATQSAAKPHAFP